MPLTLRDHVICRLQGKRMSIVRRNFLLKSVDDVRAAFDLVTEYVMNLKRKTTCPRFMGTNVCLIFSVAINTQHK